jgi:hypothetical protein
MRQRVEKLSRELKDAAAKKNPEGTAKKSTNAAAPVGTK